MKLDLQKLQEMSAASAAARGSLESAHNFAGRSIVIRGITYSTYHETWVESAEGKKKQYRHECRGADCPTCNVKIAGHRVLAPKDDAMGQKKWKTILRELRTHSRVIIKGEIDGEDVLIKVTAKGLMEVLGFVVKYRTITKAPLLDDLIGATLYIAYDRDKKAGAYDGSKMDLSTTTSEKNTLGDDPEARDSDVAVLEFHEHCLEFGMVAKALGILDEEEEVVEEEEAPSPATTNSVKTKSGDELLSKLREQRAAKSK